MNPQTPPVIAVSETPTTGPPAPAYPGAAPEAGVPTQMPAGMGLQTPAATKVSRKRKRMVDIDELSGDFNVIPKDYEAAWKKLQSRIEEVSIPGRLSTLTASSLESTYEALRLFKLRESDAKPFANIQGLPIPQYLKDNIARIYSVTDSNKRSNNEAFSRTVLDQILICSLYEEGQRSNQQPEKVQSPNSASHVHPPTSDTSMQEDPAKLALLHEMPLSKLVTHEGETKLLSGFADYSVWYDSEKKKTFATNVLIVEAKRWGTTDLAMPQLAAYLGIVHTTRREESKENSVVYGAASDGRIFRFCRVDNNGFFVQSRLLEWEEDADQIYSIIRSLLREAALSSPSTTPIKDPMQRKIVLESFSSPQRSQKFDYGPSKLTVYYEEDLEEGDEIVPWFARVTLAACMTDASGCNWFGARRIPLAWELEDIGIYNAVYPLSIWVLVEDQKLGNNRNLAILLYMKPLIPDSLSRQAAEISDGPLLPRVVQGEMDEIDARKEEDDEAVRNMEDERAKEIKRGRQEVISGIPHHEIAPQSMALPACTGNPRLLITVSTFITIRDKARSILRMPLGKEISLRELDYQPFEEGGCL